MAVRNPIVLTELKKRARKVLSYYYQKNAGSKTENILREGGRKRSTSGCPTNPGRKTDSKEKRGDVVGHWSLQGTRTLKDRRWDKM